ncbi:Validamine 7-phosphate valienyltransferase [Rubrobacter xylanophilus DSM 9941]|uniref:Trehalose-6-phosphate synthase n=1 Tax=Rubrobacter xylanophilus TaxID=49319 RepID=B8R7Q2_9ACTN|nr:trehalose-6-phosphate synthase [Rubrobacter xylanophilus]QYJ16006.1 Validamine 7-phosphate valienyltransferase [Rubrobacter xylanophilus DSM 9941]
MAQSGGVVIVSNRAPVTFSRSESGERTYARGAGGLVTALNAVSRRAEGALWIASAASEEDVRVAREPGVCEIEDLRIVLVEHDPSAYDLMYNHLANPLLWFVQHGLYDLPYAPELGGETLRAWEEGYLPTNRNFARAAAEALSDMEEPVVLLHDYHLYMVPELLREEVGEEPLISFFVHIPWPEPGLWRVLPSYIREGVLRSLLRSDIVAFHTRRYARNFMASAAELLGAEVDPRGGAVRWGGREVWVRSYPISIDPAEFEEAAESPEVLREEEYVRNLPGALLVRVDRADLSKNVVRGFRAYGRMLELHPEMRGRVTFLAQVQPSRGDIPEYAAYAEAIRRSAGEVNEAFGTPSWRPVELSMQDNFPRSVAAYKNYDALLVNAVRDGMNLVAKEAAVVNRKDGVLILSENAGAHEELKDNALSVNPFDLDDQAAAIHRALTMPAAERARRARALREAVLSNTIEDWVAAQMHDMAARRKAFS